MSTYHTQLIPSWLVRGKCSVEIQGRRRSVKFSRVVPAANQSAARSAALARIAYDTRGRKPRWSEVEVKWIANQYMWVFDEEEAEAQPMLKAQPGGTP